MPSLVEIVMIASVAISVPTFAMAMWHGWRIELYRSEQDQTVHDDGNRP